MSSKLFSYLLKNNQWIKSDAISIDDVTVLVDTTRDIIWYLEEKKATARKKFEARGLLGELKKKYEPYKFKKIDSRAPIDVLDKIEELKKSTSHLSMKFRGKEIQEFSKYLYFLNIVAGVLQVISMIIITWALSWPQVYDSQSYLNYIINSNHFYFYIELDSLLLFFSLIIFIFTSFFGIIILRRKIFTTSSIFLAVIIFLSLIYIRIGPTLLYFQATSPFPNVLIRVDAFLFFIIGVDIILFVSIVGSIIPGTYWLIKKNIKKI